MVAVLALSLAPAWAVAPGSSNAQEVQNFDPFNPTAAPQATSAAPAAGKSVATASMPTVPSSITMPRTPVNPCPPCLSVLDPETVVQTTSTKTTVVFTVTLSFSITSTVTVHYATANGTDGGNAGDDYEAKSGTLTFLSGQTTQTVSVTILPETAKQEDFLLQGLEHFYLILSDPVNATICRAKATAAIQPPVIFVSVLNAPNVLQSSNRYTTAVFTIKLSSPCTTPVTVKYATADGSAIHNIDYVPTTGSIVIPPGVSSVNVNVQVLPGDNPTNRIFYLVATSATGAPGIQIYQGKGSCEIVGENAGNVPSIAVNDCIVYQSATSRETAVFVVELSSASSKTVTVKYSTSDGDPPNPAKAGLDYLPVSGTITFDPGQTAKSVAITILPENSTVDERFHLNLSSATGAPIGRAQGTCKIVPSTIDLSVVSGPNVERLPTADTTATFTITLSSPSSKTPITVNYATVDGTAKAGVDYRATSGALIFAPGQSSKTISVTVLPGSETSTKTFYLKASNAVGATIVVAEAPDEITAMTCCNNMTVISVLDTTVIQSKTLKTVANFTVTLNASCNTPVTVNYATVNGGNTAGVATGEAGEDYVAVKGTLTFNPGEVTKTVPVTVVPENENYDEIFSLKLSNATGATIIRSQGTCWIIPATIDVATTSPAPVKPNPKADAAMTFAVSLSGSYNKPVTVQYATSDGTAVAGKDYIAASGTLTFPMNVTAQTVTVKLLPGSGTPNKTFYLNLSHAAGYSGVVVETPKVSAVIGN